tara:strand:+ start:757 stop:1224 length:468 start_codon:yes stop_codon:yes gene_type:complete
MMLLIINYKIKGTLMKSKSLLKAAVSVTLILHLTACGTLLYPERKGQTGGRIDAGVAALNGVGLLLFVIPGLIAYAVDFNNGTIYLPNSANADTDENDGLYTIKVDGPLTKDESRRLIEDHVGGPVDWSQLQTRSMEGVNADSITASLNKVQEAR